MAELDHEVRQVALQAAYGILNKQHSHLIDDVVSHVMIQWEDWKHRGIENPKGWAATVSRREALRIIAREKRQVRIAKEMMPHQVLSSVNDGIVNLATQECQNTILSLIPLTEKAKEVALDKTDNAIYEALWRKKLDYPTIAAELGMEEEAVRQRVCRIPLKIGRELEAQIRISNDQRLKQMLKHVLEDPNVLRDTLKILVKQLAIKGKDAFEKAIREASLGLMV